jgi:hypothetical protein
MEEISQAIGALVATAIVDRNWDQFAFRLNIRSQQRINNTLDQLT